MSRFNKKSQGIKTVNFAGGKSYSQNSKLELASILLTSFANDQFYRSSNNTFERLKQLLKGNELFAAKAAIYARKEFGMRSISHILASELAKHISGKSWAKYFYEMIIKRPDDITEIIAYHFSKNEKLSAQMKKGLSKAFDKFDYYQLSKYKVANNAVKLVDAVNLLHPKATEKNRKALNELINGNLKNIDTWETKLTQIGQSDSDNKEQLKGEAWKELLKENKLGYFALLRNLRNIFQVSDSETKNLALSQLTDENKIKKSLVLPFRFFTAIEELQNENIDRNVIIALSEAAEISLNNIPAFDGNTLIAIDVSGSMNGKPEKIARMFGSVLYKRLNSNLLTFANDAKYIVLNPNDSLLSLTKGIHFRGGGTNFQSIFDRSNEKFNRIIILSDMQAWMNNGYYNSNPKDAFINYKQRTGANPLIYSFDLQGYGTMKFPEQNVFCLTGFSDKIFDIMKLLETDKNALITEIEKINFADK